MIKVVNTKDHSATENDFYIGRGSALGNPYTSKELSKTIAQFQSASVEESISDYETYLLKKIEEKDDLICEMINRIYTKALSGDVYLVCFCKPNKCHGDVIKRIVNKMLSDRINRLLNENT